MLSSCNKYPETGASSADVALFMIDLSMVAGYAERPLIQDENCVDVTVNLSFPYSRDIDSL